MCKLVINAQCHQRKTIDTVYMYLKKKNCVHLCRQVSILITSMKLPSVQGSKTTLQIIYLIISCNLLCMLLTAQGVGLGGL